MKRIGIKTSYNIIDPRIIFPALGQGAIALVVNEKNKEINRTIRKLNHNQTFIETECERIFLSALDGSCQTPVGGYALLKNIENKKKIVFNYIAFSNDGTCFVKDEVCLSIKDFRSESYDLGVKVKKKIK